MNLFGLYNTADDDYNTLVNNDEIIHKSGLAILNKYGIRNDSTTLLLDDSIVGKGITSGEISDTDRGPCIDNTPMDMSNRKVDINIEDYNNINNNVPADGCMAYNPTVRYNILNTDLEENVETSATFSKEECPRIHLKFVELRIKQGEYLKVPYFVDNHYADSIRKFIVGDTFTVIIETTDGVELYKRTHYAGEYDAYIGPFNTMGEQWLQIRAIDQDGCGSPVQFFEVYVESNQQLNLKQVTYDDLRSYDITCGPGSSDDDTKEIEAYTNKLGFSALFKDIKTQGYDGAALPENETFNITYAINEITDKNRATPRNRKGPMELSNVKYYKVKVAPGTTSGEYIYTEVVKLDWNTFYNECKTNVWYNLTDDKIIWGEYKTGDKGTILPKGPCYAITPNTDWYSLTDEQKQECLLKTPQKTSFIPILNGKVMPHGSTAVDVTNVGLNGYLYMLVVKSVTYSEDYMDNFKKKIDFDNPPSDTGWVGDNLIFPNDFVLDMRGSTFKAIDTSMYWSVGSMIKLFENDNVRITNGKFVGNYADYYNPDKTPRYFVNKYGTPSTRYYTRNGVLIKMSPLPTPGEGTNLVNIRASKNCKIDHVDISYSLGYEFGIDSYKYGCITATPEFKTYTESNITSLINELRSEINGSLLSSEVKEGFPYESLIGRYTRTISVTKPISIPVDSKVNIHSNIYTIYFGGGLAGSAQYSRRRYFTLLLYGPSGGNTVLKKILKTGNGEHIIIPNGIKSFRVLVYGSGGAFDDNGYPEQSDNCPKGPTMWILRPAINAFINGCTIHDTRSCVYHPNTSTATTFKDCIFTKIATATTRAPLFKVTPCFGDFEEGGVSIGRSNIYNCRIDLGEDEYETTTIENKYPYQINIENSVNFGLRRMGTLDCVILINSVITNLTYYPCANSYACHALIRDCSINKDPDGFWFSTREFEMLGGDKPYYKHYSKVARTIGMRDVVINNRIKYNRFNLHRVKNGKQIFD